MPKKYKDNKDLIEKIKKDDTNYYKVLGEKFRELRLERSLSQTDVMEALGWTSTGAVSLVEQGKRGMSFQNIAKSAKLLNVPVAVLMNTEDYTSERLQMVVMMMDLISGPKNEEFKAIKTFLKNV